MSLYFALTGPSLDQALERPAHLSAVLLIVTGEDDALLGICEVLSGVQSLQVGQIELGA